MTYQFDHIHLRSPDPQTAARFYVDMFEAESLGTIETERGIRAIIKLGGQTVFIEQVPPDTAVPPPPPYVGIEHLGLRVSRLDEVVARLKAKGVKFVVEPRQPKPGLRIAFLEGPDKVRIELLERGTA